MKRSITSYILILLILFQVISAVPSGFVMIIDPSGGILGLPIEMLVDSPFKGFLIPGLFLFFFLGIFPAATLYGLLKRNSSLVADKINLYKNYHWSWAFSYYIGLLLITWVNVQLLFIKGFHIYHFIYSMLGVLIVFITHLSSTKRDYKKNIDEY